MSLRQPLWLKVVTKLERVIGEPIERAVRSDTYFDVVAAATRNQRRIVNAVEGLSTCWLHLRNMPASTDIRGLREQLNRMERRLAEVTKELEDLPASNGDLGRPTRAR
jgi:hypothetical protein